MTLIPISALFDCDAGWSRIVRDRKIKCPWRISIACARKQDGCSPTPTSNQNAEVDCRLAPTGTSRACALAPKFAISHGRSGSGAEIGLTAVRSLCLPVAEEFPVNLVTATKRANCLRQECNRAGVRACRTGGWSVTSGDRIATFNGVAKTMIVSSF